MANGASEENRRIPCIGVIVNLFYFSIKPVGFAARYTTGMKLGEYTIKTSRRAKYMRLTVREGGAVVVTVPFGADLSLVDAFVHKHAKWIDRIVKRFKRREPGIPLPSGRADYMARKEEARMLIIADLERVNRFYRFDYGRVSIRNQRSCWGSCSARNNLNFNYRLLYLPQELREYVMAHELCHLRVFGHGAEFWRLVEAFVPDWRERRKTLRRYRLR